MEIVQILIGSMFSLISMATVLYIGFRAHTVAQDLSEIKELLKLQQKPVLPAADLAPLERAVSTLGHPPGEWPSVTDPSYNAEASKASESPR